jgi:hypothetical protein
MTDSPCRLRIKAVDAEDLAVLSALLQDSLVTVGDIALFQAEDKKQMALLCSRYCWENKDNTQRQHALLVINDVVQAQYKCIDRSNPAQILSILSLQLNDEELRIVFADDAVLRLSLQQPEIFLSDLADPWPTQFVPCHAAPAA